MPEFSTAEIRSVALVGHGGVGKTSLLEALLHRCGAIGAPGTVARGDTVSDHDPQEKQHQFSLNASVASGVFESKRVQFVDTPGSPDLLGRALPVLAAVDAVAVVLDARGGVDTGARRMVEAARARELPCLLVVNKIDLDELDLAALTATLNEVFGPQCLPIDLPADAGRRVADCFFDPVEVATDFSSVEAAHEQLVDQVVELDETLMELYLEEGEQLAPERLHDAFEQALRAGHLMPVCFVSAASGAGVEALLRVLARLMPSPAEASPPALRRRVDGDLVPVQTQPDPGAPVLAHVFKVAIDTFTGRTAYLRVLRGVLGKETQLHAAGARKAFKVGHLFLPQGKDLSEVEAAGPGEICALAKAEDLYYGALLHESPDDEGLEFVPVPLPEPMHGVAIAARNHGEEQRLAEALAKVCAEDPCLRVEHASAFNETVLRGLGELHLRLTIEKLRERYNVEVETRPPRIAYRETIRGAAEGQHRHKKQTGGAGQFGEVWLRVEPLERGAGFEFVDAVVGGAIPSQFIPAVEKGVRQVLESGCVAGYPMVDLRVTVYDGKHHPVDSKEVAFVAAARKAFLEAVRKADPIILEPYVDLEVTIDQNSMGDIAGNLAGRRGRISATTSLADGRVSVHAQAPLGELADYQTYLKAVTGDSGVFTMALSHYEPAPAGVQQRLVAEYHPHAEED